MEQHTHKPCNEIVISQVVTDLRRTQKCTIKRTGEERNGVQMWTKKKRCAGKNMRIMFGLVTMTPIMYKRTNGQKYIVLFAQRFN